MYIDGHLPGEYGETHKISGLPTLLFTATSVILNVDRCLTLDVKEPGDYIYLIGDTRSELGGSEFYELFGYVGLNVPEVRPKDFLQRYRQIEEVIEAGLLASCHGVYRGGLALHLAMKAMAGELGLEVDLAGVAENPVVALYSESAGRFLVTVAPDDCQRFETLMAEAPLQRLGRVRADQRYVVQWGDRDLVQTEVGELKATWKQRFGELI